MIKVEFQKKSGNFVSVVLKGHAESSDKRAYDFVCCAVSVLSQSIFIGLTEVLEFDVKYSIDDGFLSFSLENMSISDIEKCQVLMNTMFLGLDRIKLIYSKYISICVKEV